MRNLGKVQDRVTNDFTMCVLDFQQIIGALDLFSKRY